MDLNTLPQYGKFFKLLDSGYVQAILKLRMQCIKDFWLQNPHETLLFCLWICTALEMMFIISFMCLICSCAQKGICLNSPSWVLENYLSGRQTLFKISGILTLILIIMSQWVQNFCGRLNYETLCTNYL